MTIQTRDTDFITIPSAAGHQAIGTQDLLRSDHHRVCHMELAPEQTLASIHHLNAAKLWYVLSGAAEVTLSGLSHTYFEGETIDVPLGSEHQLRNPGKIPLS